MKPSRVPIHIDIVYGWDMDQHMTIDSYYSEEMVIWAQAMLKLTDLEMGRRIDMMIRDKAITCVPYEFRRTAKITWRHV